LYLSNWSTVKNETKVPKTRGGDKLTNPNQRNRKAISKTDETFLEQIASTKENHEEHTTGIEYDQSDIDPNNMFNNINPHPEFCPYATCNNSPICSPCARRFVIEIAEGRSGSTTVMTMLDQLPNLRMAGENNGILIHQLDDVKAMAILNKYYQGAWQHNSIPEQALACPIQKFIEVINPPKMSENILIDDKDTIIGFKTIRLHNNMASNVFTSKEICEFIIQYYPCSKILVNYRSDTQALLKSRHHTFGKNDKMDKLIRDAQKLQDIAQCLDSKGKVPRMKMIDMNEWSSSESKGVEVFNDVAKFLGYKNCSYPFVVHNNDGGYNIDKRIDQLKLNHSCQPP
jgi:hypothetical protein